MKKANAASTPSWIHWFRTSKTGQRLRSAAVSPFTLGVLMTALLTSIAMNYYAGKHRASKNDRSMASFIQQIHEKTLDWRLTNRGPAYGSDRVAILAVDERSIQQEGRWPWPRNRIAQMTERALKAGAKIIAFDMIFSEEDANSSVPTLTSIRRQLRDQSRLSTDVADLIDKEIARADLDQSLGDAVKTQADHLVMGAFFEGTDTVAPYGDYCIDALFGRRAESRYWRKQASDLKVQDAELLKIKLPEQIGQNLDSYFTLLEVRHSNTWFERNPSMIKKIIYSLDDMGIGIPPEAIPGIAVYWLNNDLESGKTIMEQINPKIASDEGTRAFYTRFGAAFTKQEAGELAMDVRTAGQLYCERFLTANDELKDPAKFKTIWGEGEDASAQYSDFAWTAIWPKLPASQKASATETLDQAIRRIVHDSLTNSVPHVLNWTVNISAIADVAKRSGYFNAVQDTDGSIRRTQLIARRGNLYMPSLAFQTFLLDQGFTADLELQKEHLSRRNLDARVVRSLRIKNAKGETALQIPVDYQGYLLINYAGGANMFPHISAADILSDRDTLRVEQTRLNPKTGRYELEIRAVKKTEFLKDKLLIAGATAMGVYDLRVTPFEENYPGVETHANVLSNLLVELTRSQGQPISAGAPGFLRTHPKEEHLMILVMIGIGLTLSALLTYFGSVAGLLVTALFTLAIYVVDKFILFKSGIAVTTFLPMALLTLVFVTLTFYKYFTEERTKRELKGTFEKYVSPSIVAEVLADPSNIELGGKKVEMTVMFSDVRGFTTISERLDPRELSNLLNSYLTPMTALVFKHNGTLDKYMGDAIMAFWGAPIHFPDHAQHACRCALEMLAKLRELQAEYRAQGLPEIDIGIGLNTGEMSVGNMGSDTVRSYTVMGDAVNLGSRLEGINKEYGTRIIISEFTKRAIGDQFVTREVDWVRVKGKNEPVRIFELVAEKDQNVSASVLTFQRGFNLYHERRFDEALAAFLESAASDRDDKCAQLYVKRCEEYLVEPPDAGWDGVYTMKTK